MASLKDLQAAADAAAASVATATDTRYSTDGLSALEDDALIAAFTAANAAVETTPGFKAGRTKYLKACKALLASRLEAAKAAAAAAKAAKAADSR